MPPRFRGHHPGHRSTYFAEPKCGRWAPDSSSSVSARTAKSFPSKSPSAHFRARAAKRWSAARSGTSLTASALNECSSEKNLELEKASKAKDRFLASMSHELRTPLNAIFGFTGTLLMRLPGPLTVDQEHQLDMVRTSARHLLSLINDLLDLARIESGKVVFNTEPVTCSARVLNEVVATLGPLAEAKGLRFELSMPAQDVTWCAPTAAPSGQILINLINNAIKFTDKGLVRLEIGDADPDGPHCAEIRVVDTEHRHQAGGSGETSSARSRRWPRRLAVPMAPVSACT